MEFFYRVKYFEPPYEIGKMGGFGFGVEVDKRLINFSLQKEITEKQYEFMQKDAAAIIKGVGLAKKDEVIRTPCHFLSVNNRENLSCFMQYCTVPGNACELGIDGMKIDELRKEGKSYLNFVEYTSHNIDNHTQAYALLSIWFKWVDMLNSIYSSE